MSENCTKCDRSDRKVGYLLKLVNDKLRTKADANLLEHGLTLSQSRILRFLGQKGLPPRRRLRTILGFLILRLWV